MTHETWQLAFARDDGMALATRLEAGSELMGASSHGHPCCHCYHFLSNDDSVAPRQLHENMQIPVISSTWQKTLLYFVTFE
jgi:hypothetical protein